MSEIENPRWIRYPEVSFKHQTLMMVNGRPLEIPDIPTGVLEDTLRESTDRINEQIEYEYLWDRENNPQAIRPAILIARLALKKSEEKVLSKSGIIDMKSSNFHTSIYVLNKEYWPYWSEVTKTGYIPEVHTSVFNGADDSVSGVWLGVRRPER